VEKSIILAVSLLLKDLKDSINQSIYLVEY